jgi:Ulp1 family protease
MLTDLLAFSDIKRHIFLTKDEKATKPWERILCDPSIFRTDPYGSVDHNNIQCLKPHKWLNDELVNAYISLCQVEARNKNTIILSTFFWTKMMDQSDVEGLGATQIFIKQIVS